MKNYNEKIKIIKAEEKDIPLILSFIKNLAEYEKLLNEVKVTEDILKENLFGKKNYAEALLAFFDNEPAGIAIYFYNFSTFLGKPGLYLEDLFVKPHLRGYGIGKALFIHLAKIAKANNCGRFEWAVLDWNEPAINFYKKSGAVALDEWTTFRLTGDKLEVLANSD